MNRKSRAVLSYLCKICVKKRTYLISPYDIAAALSKKFVLSIAEIDEIMVELSNENYIDFVISESRQGYYYCITMKKRGQSYERDMHRARKSFGLLILRSMFLATVSFIFGLILKTIFS